MCELCFTPVDLTRPCFWQARTTGKPANIADKMVEGWMKKWYAFFFAVVTCLPKTCALQARRGVPAQPELHYGRQPDCAGASGYLRHFASPCLPDSGCGTELFYSGSTDVYPSAQAAVDGVGAKLGSPLTLAHFVRLRVGDGIDKEEKDVAAEVAAAARV